LRFEVIARDPNGRARAGLLHTAHGIVETPTFMPVGTAASVKGMTQEQLEQLGVEILLANTYHLYLRPGHETIRDLGGLHRFMSWPRPILTDSGGFQIMSLKGLSKVTEDGVTFRSHLDGSSHFLTPERAVEVQLALGSDIAMILDECVAYPATHETTHRAVKLTRRWARRAKEFWLRQTCSEAGDGRREGEGSDSRHSGFGTRDSGFASAIPSFRETLPEPHIPSPESDESSLPNPDSPLPTHEPSRSNARPARALFGIVQGGIDQDLRRQSAEETQEIGFDGYAIGGLSVGEPKSDTYEVTEYTAGLLPADRPRYLMGVGTPEDLVECVAHGVDMFDCVMPTRNARNAGIFTSEGKLVIKNARYARDESPLDPACRCSVCRRYSRGYLRHLFVAGEMLAAILATHHNLYFYLDTMREIRQAIGAGEFQKLWLKVRSGNR